MKRILLSVVLFVQLALTGGALAEQVAVDFSVLGIDSIDITSSLNPDGYTLNGITFRYDDFASGVDYASVDSSGVFGSTGGALIMDFGASITALDFDFSLIGVDAAVPDALFAILKLGGEDVLYPSFPADSYLPQVGEAFGSFTYAGLAFDQAVLFFSFDALAFTVENISYNPVPIPSSFPLLASGILGLMGWRRIGRKHL